jgi:hypothetical protein
MKKLSKANQENFKKVEIRSYNSSLIVLAISVAASFTVASLVTTMMNKSDSLDGLGQGALLYILVPTGLIFTSLSVAHYKDYTTICSQFGIVKGGQAEIAYWLSMIALVIAVNMFWIARLFA